MGGLNLIDWSADGEAFTPAPTSKARITLTFTITGKVHAHFARVKARLCIPGCPPMASTWRSAS